MTREEYLRYAGSIQQAAYVRRVTYGEGRAKMGAVQVKNGPLFFTCMEDKALDIGELSYRGLQMNFLSKPGLNGRNPYDTHGTEAQRSIMGGLFFTCGLENICAPYTDPLGKEYPMHGRMRTTPAEHVCADARWVDGNYVLTVSGEMREAELFGENLVLRRTVTTVLGRAEIRIRDEVFNESFREEPLMLMYHCNLGFPFLTERCRLILPTEKITPRDEISADHVSRCLQMDPPRDHEPEYVYIHELRADGDGNTFAAVADYDSALTLEIRFNKKLMPWFMEWKSTGSGDYVLGLEPSNSAVYGRGWHEENGTLHTIAPQTLEIYELSFNIAEGMEAIKALESKRHMLMKE